ncbi:MAG: hypothetical protein GY811_11530 [Myxococcales bacterium]|nr:hypothetical protein [Myxococcales bacterium]
MPFGSTIRNIDLATLVSAAYRTDLDDDAWLTGVGEAFEVLVGHGEGANLYLYEAQDNTLQAVGRPVEAR